MIVDIVTSFLVKIAETELAKGIKTEAEHGDTIDWVRAHPKAKKREVYKHIAKDHLEESERYYKDLEVMEKNGQVDPYQQQTLTAMVDELEKIAQSRTRSS